ncbi:hypothetical protein LCGC14_1838570 [marine sediment metagenome]|uniref:HNH nuclease domain-containing protein n=1 Tax=marine sediment metagenome TaxID=412755 RepID=A0A0F9ITA3_9ZZZZ
MTSNEKTLDIRSRQQAQQTGSVTYFTGRPCKREHVCERYTKNQNCTECSKKYSKDYFQTYYKTNREIYLERSKQRSQTKEQKARCRDYARKFGKIRYETNREWFKDYRRKNKEKQQAYMEVYSKEYYERNKDSIKEASRYWRQNNPDKAASYREIRNQYLKERTPRWANLDKIKEIYLERDRLIVETGVQHHVDHVIPLNGKCISGLHIHTNLQILTAAANLNKSNKWETE